MLSGVEDLGNGNRAFFKLEQGFSMKTGASAGAATNTFFDKQAYVAMSGSWGTLQGGRMYTPYFATQALVADPSGSYALLSSSNIMETTGARLNNGIIYTLPNTADVFAITRKPGISAAVAHYFGESGAGASKNRSNGAKLGWLSDDSKFRVEIAWHRTNTYTAAAGAPPTADSTKNSVLLGAFYNFDFGRIHLAYATSKRKSNLTGGATMENFQEYMTGINTTKLGPGRFMFTVIYKDYKNSDPRGLKDRWQIGANYDYFLSRRTKIMFGVVANLNKGKDDQYAANTNSYAGAPATAGRSAALAVGLNHSF
jgi:predicted porin